MQKTLNTSANENTDYWVRASNGSAVRVYCDMTRSCGRIKIYQVTLADAFVDTGLAWFRSEYKHILCESPS